MATEDDTRLLLNPSIGVPEKKGHMLFFTIGMGVLNLLLLAGLATVMVLYIQGEKPVVAEEPLDDRHWEFANFMSTHGKQYDSGDEYTERKQIYEDNMKFAQEINMKHGHEFLGATYYADWKFDEFSAKMGLNQPHPRRNYPRRNMLGSVKLPKEVNWLKDGAVTDVKDQKQCGSCWAFSTTGGIEGSNFIVNQKLIPLSEQQLVDCSTNGNLGCSGGDMGLALDYVIDNNGICSEQDYKYTGRDGKCRDKCTNVVQVRSYESLPPRETNKFMQALSLQPISIAVSANIMWQLYFGGIFPASECSSKEEELNHGVLAVGYKLSEQYVLVKNSWGKSWGEDGYIKLEYPKGSNSAGTCGMMLDAFAPTVVNTNAAAERANFQDEENLDEI